MPGHRGGVLKMTKGKVRAIVIDPEARTFTEVLIGGDLGSLQRAIGCRDVTTGSRFLRGSLETGFEAVYVSDDELTEADDPKFWFQVDADRDPPSSYPIAGRGVVSGTDVDGETCDAKITIADLAKR